MLAFFVLALVLAGCSRSQTLSFDDDDEFAAERVGQLVEQKLLDSGKMPKRWEQVAPLKVKHGSILDKTLSKYRVTFALPSGVPDPDKNRIKGSAAFVKLHVTFHDADGREGRYDVPFCIARAEDVWNVRWGYDPETDQDFAMDSDVFRAHRLADQLVERKLGEHGTQEEGPLDMPHALAASKYDWWITGTPDHRLIHVRSHDTGVEFVYTNPTRTGGRYDYEPPIIIRHLGRDVRTPSSGPVRDLRMEGSGPG